MKGRHDKFKPHRGEGKEKRSRTSKKQYGLGGMTGRSADSPAMPLTPHSHRKKRKGKSCGNQRTERGRVGALALTGTADIGGDKEKGLRRKDRRRCVLGLNPRKKNNKRKKIKIVDLGTKQNTSILKSVTEGTGGVLYKSPDGRLGLERRAPKPPNAAFIKPLKGSERRPRSGKEEARGKKPKADHHSATEKKPPDGEARLSHRGPLFEKGGRPRKMRRGQEEKKENEGITSGWRRP